MGFVRKRPYRGGLLSSGPLGGQLVGRGGKLLLGRLEIIDRGADL